MWAVAGAPLEAKDVYVLHGLGLIFPEALNRLDQTASSLSSRQDMANQNEGARKVFRCQGALATAERAMLRIP
jgi:hypothetical protein